MKVNLKEEEVRYIENALDLYSRIWIGQYDKILFDLRWYRDCRQLDVVHNELKTFLMLIRNVVLPGIQEYGFNGSYGIFSDEIDFRAGVAYDMQQVFRYELAIFANPNGGYSIDYNKPMKAELDPYPFPKANCFRDENGEIVETIEICDEQLAIIKNALEITKAKYDGKIKYLFSHYYDNEEILDYAEHIDRIISNIDVEREFVPLELPSIFY